MIVSTSFTVVPECRSSQSITSTRRSVISEDSPVGSIGAFWCSV